MYKVSERDEVRELLDVPQSDVGAPLPAVIASEHRLDLIYLVRQADPNWDGSYANVVGPETEREQVACIRFEGAYAHMFGPPNDEAFHGHPLAARGLKPYAAWEVLQSSWLRSLERMNAVHPHHSRKAFMTQRHFIFAFHDSTFECIAKGYECRVAEGSIASIAAALPETWT